MQDATNETSFRCGEACSDDDGEDLLVAEISRLDDVRTAEKSMTCVLFGVVRHRREVR